MSGTGVAGAGGLLPERHPTADFFVCDIFDALPKTDMGSMEHPMFSLSTRPDRRILNYAHNGVEITVTPSVRGLATIHDKDILIFCISQLMAAINAGHAVSQVLHLKAHDLLVATNRETSGDGYKRLREAFERLAGTRITTNMVTGGLETTTGFGLIESWEIVRHTRAGRMVSVSVKLSDWLFRAVLAKSVLTLSRDYFRLRKPLERRIYELARKHCGRQTDWRVSVETLLKKSGSASPRRVFRKMLRDMIAADHLPDYALSEEPGDIIRVSRRDVVLEPGHGLQLKPETLETARAEAPGWDVYALEAEWQSYWASSGRKALRSPDLAFLGWVRKRVS
ncbi:MAG: replication initiator protein A [Pseudomonadota bacterium]